MYHNERQVGDAINEYLTKSELTREEVHYTSKLASNSDYNTARKSIKKSVKECGLGYIDLFLLHSPYGGKKARLESWRALEDAVLDGEVKTAGVSNYGIKHVCLYHALCPRIRSDMRTVAGAHGLQATNLTCGQSNRSASV